MCASHRAVRGLIVELTGYGKHTVTDMEAGLEHLKRGTAKNVDMMLIVVEPYFRSLEAQARLRGAQEEGQGGGGGRPAGGREGSGRTSCRYQGRGREAGGVEGRGRQGEA